MHGTPSSWRWPVDEHRCWNLERAQLPRTEVDSDSWVVCRFWFGRLLLLVSLRVVYVGLLLYCRRAVFRPLLFCNSVCNNFVMIHYNDDESPDSPNNVWYV
jgi:hypothetical protein